MSRMGLFIAVVWVVATAFSAYAQGEVAVRQWAAAAFASSQYSDQSWSARQATGVPDTERSGDYPSAWAPLSSDGATEWLELVYGQSVVPTAVNVRETFNPGFVVKVEAYSYANGAPVSGRLPQNAAGRWVALWTGVDETGESPGTFSPPLTKATFPTNRIRVTINTARPGWEEIDAVELVGSRAAGVPSNGEVRQWAFRATASSEYSATDWSAQQATGAPNTLTSGDISTAWAPANQDGTIEWIELFYARPVIVSQVEIRETFNPGFVTQVEGFDAAQGGWVILWQGKDPTDTSPGIFAPPISQNDCRTDRLRIFIDTNVPGWNEIDAVELIGRVTE